MHGVRAKSRFVSEIDLSACRLRLPCDGRKYFAPPSLDRFRIALISPLQRLLWRQSELGEQFTHGGQAKPNAKLALDQTGHDGSRPQPKIQPILARIAAIDPTMLIRFDDKA